jgi:AcrR family transcriptional regulator
MGSEYGKLRASRGLDLDTLSDSNIGLRERKKIRTRALIQEEALRLFLEKGFEATTVEEIAKAVEISPGTFFNYFPTKEDVVFQDDLDPVLLEAMKVEPAGLGPVAALREAIHKVYSRLTPEQDIIFRRRLGLIFANSTLRAAFLNQSADQLDQIVALVARHAGRSSKDFTVRNLAGALLGVMIATFFSAAKDPDVDLLGLADQALAHLEAGLPLNWPLRE